jgi:hypothetical protein
MHAYKMPNVVPLLIEIVVKPLSLLPLILGGSRPSHHLCNVQACAGGLRSTLSSLRSSFDFGRPSGLCSNDDGGALVDYGREIRVCR